MLLKLRKSSKNLQSMNAILSTRLRKMLKSTMMKPSMNIRSCLLTNTENLADKELMKAKTVNGNVQHASTE